MPFLACFTNTLHQLTQMGKGAEKVCTGCYSRHLSEIRVDLGHQVNKIDSLRIERSSALCPNKHLTASVEYREMC